MDTAKWAATGFGIGKGCGYLDIVRPKCGNSGNLQFLCAQLLESHWPWAHRTDAPILHAGGCQFGSSMSRPWSHAETIENPERAVERRPRGDRPTVPSAPH
jgi:hypothetical protein